MLLAATCKGQALLFDLLDLLDLLDLRKVSPATSHDKVPASAEVTPTTGAHAGKGALAPLPGTPVGMHVSTQIRAHVTPASAARRRLLHVGHFAFMRSVVQGLDLRESWER